MGKEESLERRRSAYADRKKERERVANWRAAPRGSTPSQESKEHRIVAETEGRSSIGRARIENRRSAKTITEQAQRGLNWGRNATTGRARRGLNWGRNATPDLAQRGLLRGRNATPDRAQSGLLWERNATPDLAQRGLSRRRNVTADRVRRGRPLGRNAITEQSLRESLRRPMQWLSESLLGHRPPPRKIVPEARSPLRRTGWRR